MVWIFVALSFVVAGLIIFPYDPCSKTGRFGYQPKKKNLRKTGFGQGKRPQRPGKGQAEKGD